MPLIFPGVEQGRGVYITNASVAQLAPVATTRTLITGTSLKVPPGGLKAGSRIRFVVNMAKTAAGTATSTFDIGFGTAGTTADTARVSFTKPAGTAAIDEGLVVIEATVRTVSATGVVSGEFTLIHNLAATGHAQVPCVVLNTISSGFDNSSEALYVSLFITTGASDVITIEQAYGELIIPTNGQN